jgi:hypothetical protein
MSSASIAKRLRLMGGKRRHFARCAADPEDPGRFAAGTSLS